jgi:hypothetical protein
VVPHEAFNGESILPVVSLVEFDGFFSGKAEVIFEEFVCLPVNKGLIKINCILMSKIA